MQLSLCNTSVVPTQNRIICVIFQECQIKLGALMKMTLRFSLYLYSSTKPTKVLNISKSFQKNNPDQGRDAYLAVMFVYHYALITQTIASQKE